MKRLFFSIGSIISLLFSVFTLNGCANTINYTDYVSEFRSEIYLAKQDEYALTVFFVQREYPYTANGVCATKENLVEIYLTTPNTTDKYDISFSINEKRYGGDMSYDNVYARFFYSQSMESVYLSSIPFTVTDGNGETVLSAINVKSGTELTMPEIINKLTTEKNDFFQALIDGNRFIGELYVRLVYNEKCYFFVSVHTAEGLRGCFLLDACTGELKAERSKI